MKFLSHVRKIEGRKYCTVYAVEGDDNSTFHNLCSFFLPQETDQEPEILEPENPHPFSQGEWQTFSQWERDLYSGTGWEPTG